ncbi:MAG: polyprenyl synthetase family protein [Chloroflexota bacterium]
MNTVRFFAPIESLLQQVEKRMLAEGDGYHPELNAALKHLLSSGGKRIRPAVTLLSGRMLGVGDEQLINLAASIELLHTATLVHDDLIDGAMFRRGIPTLNSKWSSAATVLTGDYIFSRAASVAANINHVPLMHSFARTLATIVDGEITQLFNARIVRDQESYYQRIYAKTASLFEMSTEAVAMLSPLAEQTATDMKGYGYQIGMAFQIVDDVLDFIGDQGQVGKPVGSDLRQSIVTLPTLYYYEDHQDDLEVRALLAGEKLEEERIGILVTNICQSGAIERVIEEARGFVRRGQEYLARMPAVRERQALVELTDYIVERRL